MKPISLLALAAALLAVPVAGQAAEFHVAPGGNDANPGTQAAPLRTIQHAADLAQPGDVITVHAGVYRESIKPPRGGESDEKRIVYQAAPGEKVEIKGSELVKNWVKVQGDVWKTTLPNSFFGNFNPYADFIQGPWFFPGDQQHHTGAVYVNGDWLFEAASLEKVMKPTPGRTLWFGKVDKTNTTIWAQFKGLNPNEQFVEINARQTIFYPEKPGMNYITIRGFILQHAATNWAPPSEEQFGLIGTNWSKGWIIENNAISYATCSGIALGKYHDKEDPGIYPGGNTVEVYVNVIKRALKHGWNKETVGHHVVRNNSISHCEQTGIVGSLGGAFSVISGNTIHDIYTRRMFGGPEIGGIKLHGPIDVVIRGNHIYRSGRGLWLDWMAQGTRVSGNLFHDNDADDVFIEVCHGPFLVDNNLLLSGVGLRDVSEGGAYAHNLLAGVILSAPELTRTTPYHQSHATAFAGRSLVKGGDDRFYNNLFVAAAGNPRAADDFTRWGYDAKRFPLQAGGNAYCSGVRAFYEQGSQLGPLVPTGVDPATELSCEGRNVYLRLTLGPAVQQAHTVLVNTAMLGKAKISGLPYENADGTPLRIDTDYFGNPRNAAHPTPGPFENPGAGPLTLKVW